MTPGTLVHQAALSVGPVQARIPERLAYRSVLLQDSSVYDASFLPTLVSLIFSLCLWSICQHVVMCLSEVFQFVCLVLVFMLVGVLRAFFLKFIFKEQFRFTMKLRGKYRDFLYTT